MKKQRITDEWLMSRCYEKKIISKTQAVYYFDAAKRFYLILNGMVDEYGKINAAHFRCRINTEPDDNWITDVEYTNQLMALYKCLTGCKLE